MGIKDISVGRKDTFIVPLDKIVLEEGYNVRAETDDLAQHIEFLANSIAQTGYDSSKPIVGIMRDDTFIVRDGHCRVRAARLVVERGVDLKGVPAVVEDKVSTEGDHLFSVFMRNTGKPLTPYEQAQVFARLLKLQWEPKDIAAKSGFSLVHVNNMLELAAAPKAVQEAVKQGEVSATLAVEVVKDHGQESATVVTEAVKVAKKSGKGKATKKHVEAVAPAAKKGAKGKKGNKPVEAKANAEKLDIRLAKVLLKNIARDLLVFTNDMDGAAQDAQLEAAQNFALIARDHIGDLAAYGIDADEE